MSLSNFPNHWSLRPNAEQIRQKITATKREQAFNANLAHVEEQKCVVCGNTFPKTKNENWPRYLSRQTCSHKCAGIRKSTLVDITCGICSTVFKVKLARKEQAKYCSKKCLGLANGKRQKGDKHWNWQGGVTPAHRLLRQSKEYNAWRRAVYASDDYTCQHCGRNKCQLTAHHIKGFWTHPKLRYVVSNGLTVCKACHKLIHRETGISARF